MTYRVALEAGKAVMCPHPFYNYFHRAGSITTAKAVTDKTFHFSQNAAQVYDHICREHPALQPQAAYLRVRSLMHLLLTLDQGTAESREKYARQVREARRELGKFTGFLLRCSRFGKQEKVTGILLIMNFYRVLRPIFHR